MTDDTPRDRPQYGEYATPEQQQEILRRAAGERAAAAEVPVVPEAPTPVAAGAEEDVERPPRRMDRFFTIAMLAYGLVSVITAIPQIADYSTFAQTFLDTAGIHAQYEGTTRGRVWSGIAALVFAVGWILTALLSWRAISRGRLSWWIALVGFLATVLVVAICLTVPLVTDPALIDAILGAT